MGIFDLIFPKKCLECGSSGSYICNNCLGKVPAGRWHKGNYSVFAYEGVVRKAILALKYKFATDVVDELAAICVDRLASAFGFKSQDSVVLVPIPLHPKRQNWRGFNQTFVLGEEIAGKMGWQFASNLLVRKRNTKPQVGLKGYERVQNLRGVFAVNNRYQPLAVGHQSLVIFDDVYTTGSTINEAGKVLIKAGCKKIFSLTIAG